MNVFEIKVPETQKIVPPDGCACLCGFMSGSGNGALLAE